MNKIFLTILTIMIPWIVFAGTYRNGTDVRQTFKDQNGVAVGVGPGQTVETFVVLDQINPSVWQKISDAPHPPLFTDEHDVERSTNGTESVAIDPDGSFVYVVNIGSTNATIYVNTTSNSYPATLWPANDDNDLDELKIQNNQVIHTLFITFLNSSGGHVIVREQP